MFLSGKKVKKIFICENMQHEEVILSIKGAYLLKFCREGFL
jgi:hypothetical protein